MEEDYDEPAAAGGFAGGDVGMDTADVEDAKRSLNAKSPDRKKKPKIFHFHQPVEDGDTIASLIEIEDEEMLQEILAVLEEPWEVPEEESWGD